MLRSIDDQGNISWHCHTPDCSYHNCAAWDKEIICPYHPNNIVGETYHTAHISNPDVRWTDTECIMLPTCAECGNQWSLNIHKEVAEPIIKKDELTGKILQVTMPPGKEHHGNLWIKDADIVHSMQPHPTLAHMPVEDIQTLQEHIKSKAPDAPTEWMLTVVPHEDIHAVYQHPAVARHQELARQLEAMGKVYVAPVEQPLEPMVPLSHIKEMVYGILKQHGIDPLEDTGKQQAIQPPGNVVAAPDQG